MSLLIDGCMVNCLPLDHVARKEGDMLVAFDTNYMDVAEIRADMVREQVEQAAEDAFYELSREQAGEIIDDFKHNQTDGLFTRLRTAGSRAMELMGRVRDFRAAAEERWDNDFGETYMSIIDRSFSIMNHHQTQTKIAQYQPDIVVRMSFDAHGDIAHYAKVTEISEIGRRLMSNALDSLS
jgi:predicted acylesterase/phospholipase RssA